MERLNLTLRVLFFSTLCLMPSACQKRTGGANDFELSHEPFPFPSGVPMPQDVHRTTSELGGEGIRFDSSLSPRELADFYRREIGAVGLREDTSSVITERALSLVFRGWPGKRALSIKASRPTSRSTVLVRLGGSSPD